MEAWEKLLFFFLARSQLQPVEIEKLGKRGWWRGKKLVKFDMSFLNLIQLLKMKKLVKKFKNYNNF